MTHRPEHTSARRGRGAVALAWLAALAAAIAALLLGAAEAEAGTYRAVQCSVDADSGHGDLSFHRTSDHYRQGSRCGSGDGLSVTHVGRRSPSGRLGAWSLMVPAELELTRLRLAVAGRSDDGHRPDVLVGSSEAQLRPLGSAAGSFHELTWEGEGAERLEARLRCAGRGECGEGAHAYLAIRGIGATLEDSGRPTSEAGGELTERTGRGEEFVDVAVGDRGSGVRRVFLEVNGEPTGSRVLECSVRQGVALRLRPCPRQASEGFGLDTTGPPFRQGPNLIRACALDYADTDGRNRACSERRVRVDNLCPISESSEGARLEARIAGAGRRGANRGEGPKLVGRLVDDAGNGVAGTEVCVATRPDAEGFAEQLAATPTTGGDGRFRVRLDSGPSREVRVAYWADSERVVERILTLRSRVRPRLELNPHGPLRNGDRLRFAVDLPGPLREGRLVVIQASSGARWQRIRSGRTNSSGRHTSSYRFHATTGTRRYRFRAFVPQQRGYPYERGRSAVRRKTVVG